jgi:tricarballylate dehydrogenase
MKQDKCDVVVIGFGNAAQAAAYSAHSTGAHTIVLEKAPENKRGGNTWFSSGAQFRHAHGGLEDEIKLLPHVNPAEFQKIDLPTYSKDDFYADLMRVTRGKAMPELAELLVNESYPTVKWMRESGINFEILYSSAVPVEDRFKWHHGLSFIHSRDGGAGLVQQWHKILNREKVEIRFGTAAVRLLTDEKGSCIGVVTQDDEGLKEIRCKAVVLGCGGFEANPAMRLAYLGHGWDQVRCRGTKYNTGDGIRMALDIGAQEYGHWSGAHATPIDSEAGDYEAGFLDPANLRNRTHRYAWSLGIVVNINGKRFIDEGEDFHAYTYAKTGAEIVKQPGSIGYQIFDTKTKEAVDRHRYDGATAVTAGTIRELAEQLDINPDVLEQTVNEFNAAVMKDKPFNQVIRDGKGTTGIYPQKTNWAQTIEKPPFTAYGCTGGLTFTFGGLKINAKCQVLNRLDKPIKGLYASGELTGGFFYYNYPSGSGLTRGAVTGRIAGGNAAAE